MSSLTPIASTQSSLRPVAEARPAAAIVRAESSRMVPADDGIAARVEAKVGNGALSAEQGQSLKEFFGDEATPASTGNLMRTASEQLDQFDRVLEKLRASMGAGATYGRGPVAGSTGLVVDRLA